MKKKKKRDISDFDKGIPISQEIRNKGKTRRELRVERFIVQQMDKYIKLHKEHEKDLRYIG